MRPEQWEIFKKAARGERLDNIPMAMIIDSPWIPGYCGVKHMDFFLNPQVWLDCHLRIHREFPDVIFVPGFWMEYGMAAEPSALGAKIKFWQDNTPSEYHGLFHIEDVDKLHEYEVEADAFMALTLHRIRMQKQQVFDAGYISGGGTLRILNANDVGVVHGGLLQFELTLPDAAVAPGPQPLQLDVARGRHSASVMLP